MVLESTEALGPDGTREDYGERYVVKSLLRDTSG